ncbi:MAG: pentapeptide repeat-containing protein, partial [bacterium]
MELNDTAEKITAKDVNLSDSSFEDADLSRVQFHDSTLQGATFR